MKKLIITGNGFDKAHGLKTTFDDFISSSTIYPNKYSTFKNINNCWYNVEDRFKELVLEKLDELNNEVAVDDIVEEIIDTYGTDEYGEVLYYDYKSDAFRKETESISSLVLLLVSFETDFSDYLRNLYRDSQISSQFHPINSLKNLFDSASRVINFNYTNVIEMLYGIHNVEHIHGNINDEIVIGCDTFDRLTTTAIRADYPSGKASGRPKDVLIERMKYYEYDMEDNLIEREPIKRFFDDVVTKTQNNEKELFKWLKMKSKDFLDFRQTIINSLSNEEFDEVHIIGHSLGQADWSIFNSLNSKKTICYFHDKDDYKRKTIYIKHNGWDIILRPDTEIF